MKKKLRKMDDSIYFVTGTVRREDTRGGVWGLRIEAWDEDLCKSDYLGVDCTNADGSFKIAFQESDFAEPFEGDPEIYLKVYDCDCRLIYDTREDLCRCRPGKQTEINLSLVPDILWWHLKCPAWVCPEDPVLLAEKTFDEIEEAIEELFRPGTPAYNESLAIVNAITPPIQNFDCILEDACKTLNGDLDAASRYRDALEALCSDAHKHCCESPGPYADILDELFGLDCPEEENCDPCKNHDSQKATDKSENIEEEECCRPEAEIPCPCKESLISLEKRMFLLMAALHISCRHEKTAKTYLGILLDQLCRYELLGALHRAAVLFLCGDKQAAKHFTQLLNFSGLSSHNDDQSRYLQRIWHPHTPTCCEICLDDELLNCLKDAICAWREIDCYTIKKITPPRACPGEIICIKGTGFGYCPGLVQFRAHGSLTLGPVAIPEEWCDDTIRVRVPQEAGCGLVLILPPQTIKLCGRFVQYRPTGCIKQDFEGTSPEILKFHIKGLQDGDCLEPGAELRIRWKTCAADLVKVEIINSQTNQVIAQQNPADARGCWDFTNTDFTETTYLTIRITAIGQCDPKTVSQEISLIFQKPFDLSIEGAEVTQAIQYYNASQHLTDAADRGPNNSVQLVARKSAWVRVYMRSGQDPSFGNGQLPDTTGSLRVERRVGGIWSVVDILPPVNAPVTVEDSFPTYDSERANINASLNFIIPSGVMIGLLRFIIDVNSPFACVGGNASDQLTIDVDLQQELRIAAVSVGYNGPPIGGGPNVNFPAPTAGQIATEANFALTVFPVQNTPNIRIIDTVNATQPLDDNTFPAGGCDPNWGPIITQVANARTNDGNQAGWIYYGFVTASLPRIHGNVGCASGGNAAGLLGSGTTFAHEVGHQVGLRHAPCGAVGSVIPGFPLYEPYDTGITFVNGAGNTVYQDASIGEYGLDINTGTIYNPHPLRPNNGKDLMSYCGNRWVSLFLHNWMINNATLNPVILATGEQSEQRLVQPSQSFNLSSMRPYVTVVGKVSANETIEVSSLARVPTHELAMHGSRTAYELRLVGKDGLVVSRAPVFTIPAHEGTSSQGCGCGSHDNKEAEPPFMFIAAMPDVTEGKAIQICKGDEVVWERKCPKEVAEIKKLKVEVKEGRLYISWDLRGPVSEETEAWIRWSEDGKEWNGLQVGIKDTSVKIDAGKIPVEKAMFEVFVHTGYHSISERSDFVKLPPKPVELAILHPTENALLSAQTPLRLWGTMVSGATKAKASWYVDGKKVGDGLDIWVPPLKSGSHTIELRIGKQASTTVKVSTRSD